jgi:hypothetical protein
MTSLISFSFFLRMLEENGEPKNRSKDLGANIRNLGLGTLIPSPTANPVSPF